MLAQKERELTTPPPEVRAYLNALAAQEEATESLRKNVARYKGLWPIFQKHPELAPVYGEPLRKSIEQQKMQFNEPPFNNATVQPLNATDPLIQKAQAEANAMNARAAYLETIPRFTVHANQRINIRNMPNNAKNAVTGIPISYNKPVLDFEGEYAAGRFYQASAPSVLESRRHPRTDATLTDVTWYTPRKPKRWGFGRRTRRARRVQRRQKRSTGRM